MDDPCACFLIFKPPWLLKGSSVLLCLLTLILSEGGKGTLDDDVRNFAFGL